VGVGREATRSLDGIEIVDADDNLLTTLDREVHDMDREELMGILRDVLPEMFQENIQGLIPSIVAQIREDANRVNMTITPEEFRDLVGRAGTISMELKGKVVDMALEGRSTGDINTAIIEFLQKGNDAEDHGDRGTDLETNDPPGGGNGQQTYRMDTITDEDFIDMVTAPAPFSFTQ
jgi:hypothetical protein